MNARFPPAARPGRPGAARAFQILHTITRHNDRILSSAAVAALILTVVTFLGREYWLLELTTHFRLHLGVGATALVVVAAIRRRPALVLLVLIAAAVNVIPLLPYFMQGAIRAHAASTSVRIMFANVNLRNADYAQTLELIRAEGPDIVGLAEVDASWIDGLSGLRESYPHRVVHAEDGAYGLALFSRFPVRELDSSPYSERDVQTAIMVQVELHGKPVALTLAHLMAPMSQDKANLRNVQVETIARMAQRNKQAQIVVGDLNLTPWSPYYAPLEEAGLINAARGHGYKATFPASLGYFGIPIDHVLFSDDLQVYRWRTSTALGSDHLPIIADIALHNFGAEPAQ
jgi:endonuclease/exonuclease/phosphatase (EEP) superfamily protein YafD